MNEISGLDYDQLTGLRTRWHLYVEIQQILDAGDYRVYVTLDVDNFKHINERYGTQAGDRLLCSIADALREVYEGATFYRVSGDEFGLLLPPTRYSRYQMSMMTRSLFDHLHQLRIEAPDAPAHSHLSFSIGSAFIDPTHLTTPDAVLLEARACRLDAKKHEGNFLSSRYGSIPDVEGAFMILCDDRRQYDEINDRSIRIKDESDWMSYLQESARLKGDLYRRNQSQLDDILAYYRVNDLPDCEYEQLFQVIVNYATWIDAMMFETLIAGVLLPYYEQCDRTKLSVRSRLGHLYLLLADSLISLYRMGSAEQGPRIARLLQQCLDVCRDIPHDLLQFEPYYLALCEMVGHYESLEQQFFTMEQIDAAYEELRTLTLGPDPAVLPDAQVVAYFDSLIQNARFYPLYRLSFLTMRIHALTDAEREELERRKAYVSQHLVNGVYDMADGCDHYRQMARFWQDLVFVDEPIEHKLTHVMLYLRRLHETSYGAQAGSNLVAVVYLFRLGEIGIEQSQRPEVEQHGMALAGTTMLIELLRKRESRASDAQLIFLTEVLMRTMMRTSVLSAADKLYFLEQAMAALMPDTYGHSKAVAAYARVIVSNIVDHYPQLLAGSDRPYATAEEVTANREALLAFMDKACMLHDIGKMKLTPITSNAYRRLTDQEFALIRRHPEEGVDMLSLDPAFEPFLPFVYNHHRWWDDTSGYPSRPYGGQHSRMQVLVDVLAMCDSLEAATSHVGRNYRKAKSFTETLDEFFVQSGTRYSSEVLHTIISSSDTYYKLRQMVDTRWQDIYRDIYQQVVQSCTSNALTEAVAPLPGLYADGAAAPAAVEATDCGIEEPGWLRQMSPRTRQVYTLSLMKRGHIAVADVNLINYTYFVDEDLMGIEYCGDDGQVNWNSFPHFSDMKQHYLVSQSGYTRIVETLQQVLAAPADNRMGTLKLENNEGNRTLLASYNCVTDRSGRVLAVTGYLEDYYSTRSRLLETIQQQNRYTEMLFGLMRPYIAVVYTDLQLEKFEVLKAFPRLEEAAKEFNTTRQLLDFSALTMVDREYRDDFLAFCCPDTFVERLQGQPRITFEYHSPISGWLMAHLMPARLDTRSNVTHVLLCIESVEDEHQQMAYLSYAAHHDALTGLYNRLQGEALISEAIAKGGTQVFAILDCDNFKRINDQLSHLVGDKVLREVGRAMHDIFPHDVCMRLGGDEFVIYICGETAYRLVNSFSGVLPVFQRLAARIATIRLPELDNVPPTFSCGVVFTDGSVSGLTFDDLYQPADEALHVSKQSRNGRITVAEFRYRDYLN